MRGRRPKPSGMSARRPHRHDEPKAKLPSCPRHLRDEARKEWFRTGRKLLTFGLVTEIDVAALAVYCQAWGRWVEAEEALRQYGVVIKSPSGFPMQSPFLAVANKALEQMRSFLVEFGMTPATRMRVHAERPSAASPLDAFIRRGADPFEEIRNR